MRNFNSYRLRGRSLDAGIPGRRYQKGTGCFGVVPTDLQTHAAAQWPLESGDIGIGEKALNSGGFQTTFGHERLGHVAEVANGDEFGNLMAVHALIIRLRGSTI